MKRLLLPLLLACSLVLFTFYRTDGFFLFKIRGPLIEGVSEKPVPEYMDALHQPFHYLAKGRQCFVFESADRQTVIKFINYTRFSFPFWLKVCPLPHYWKMWILGLENQRRRRFDDTVKSFQIAKDHLIEETGLLYLHLQQGGELPILQAVDRAHRVHQIDLNSTAFVLQKRATPIFEDLENRWKSGQKDALNEGIRAFVGMIEKRCLLHIADDDRDVGINFGFCNSRLMLLDPGRLYYDPTLVNPDRVYREMLIATKRFRQWLLRTHPDVVPFMDEQVQAVLLKEDLDKCCF